MEKSSFFNSVNGDRKYNAQDFASYFNSFIGNGVFGNTHLQIQANNNMTITLKEGKAWANGYIYLNDSDLIKTIEPADGVLNRIDRLVLRLDYVNREIKSYIKKGTFASSPVAPTLQRDADMYELGIADIYIAKGATSILQANITDTRANPALCGWVNTLISGNIDALITDINSLEQTVQALSSLMADLTQSLETHKENSVAHGTAAKAEAQAGTSHASYMTPLRTKEAIQALQAVASVAGKTGTVSLVKSDVGLGSVENYGIATQAEAQTGTSNTKYMTPLRVKESVASLGTKIASGSYVGDGVVGRFVTIGFTPKVILMSGGKYSQNNTAAFSSAIFTQNNIAITIRGDIVLKQASSDLGIISNGFKIGGSVGEYILNVSDQKYEWVAIG